MKILVSMVYAATVAALLYTVSRPTESPKTVKAQVECPANQLILDGQQLDPNEIRRLLVKEEDEYRSKHRP
jgi:hypothetical protein